MDKDKFFGKGIKLSKSSDVNSLATEMKKDKKLVYTSDLGLIMALNDAKQDGNHIFVMKKELKINPTNSEFSIIKNTKKQNGI
jgi:hypothetical protein